MRNKPRSTIVPSLLTVLAVAACGGSTTDPNPDPQVSLSTLSNSVAQGATIVQLSQAQQAISELSGVISQIVATDGFPLGCGDCHQGGIPSVVPRQSVLGPALARRRGLEEARHVTPRRTALDPGLTVASLSSVPQRANLLGTTCVWNPAADFWGNNPNNPYGDPEPDAVFFELYDAQGARPVIPLSLLNGYASVAPRGQGPQVDVGIFVNLDDQMLIDFETSGTADEEGGYDVSVDGSFADDGAGGIDYTSDLTPARSETSASLLDLEVGELLTVGSGGAFSFTLDVGQTTGARQQLAFDVDFDANNGVTSGTVVLDGEVVGTVTGTLSGLVFALTPDSPLAASERARLESIFQNASIITGGVFEHVLFGACVGTMDHSVCTAIDPGAPSPP